MSQLKIAAVGNLFSAGRDQPYVSLGNNRPKFDFGHLSAVTAAC
jgi:hypothetical protein